MCRNLIAKLFAVEEAAHVIKRADNNFQQEGTCDSRSRMERIAECSEHVTDHKITQR